MKYKKGDKIRIKTWGSMVKEFGLDYFGNIDIDSNREYFPTPNFRSKREKWIQSSSSRDFTIKEVGERSRSYTIEEDKGTWLWVDKMIEYSLKELKDMKSWEPIETRFEILDL